MPHHWAETALRFYNRFNTTCKVRVKVNLDYEILFRLMDGLRPDTERRYSIERKKTEGNISDIQVDTGQMSTSVEILLTMSNNTLTIAEEYIQ